MHNINYQTIRIEAIRHGPFSWKEKDLLTGAEKYLSEVIDLSIVEMTQPYFSALSDVHQYQIELVWQYQMAAYHLKQMLESTHENTVAHELTYKSSSIYTLEAQRHLGSLFALEHDFWKVFYKRQEAALDKALIALDALHFASNKQHPIVYQLLQQALRTMLKGYYAIGKTRLMHFKNASKLLVDLPLPQLQQWLNRQATKLQDNKRS